MVHATIGMLISPQAAWGSDGGVLNVMEFASQEPEISFHEIIETGRLELIKALRSQGQARQP